MKAAESYKRADIQDRYDAIVIGSGLGGLATAAILAKRGQQVLVLEQHYTAGGYTHVFKRRDYEWDVGLHYVGDVEKPQTFLRTLFDYVTDAKLEWADMGQVYDRVVVGEKIYEFHKGREAFKAKLKEYFPDPKDQEAIDEYVERVRQTVKSGRTFFMEKALPPFVGWIASPFLRPKLLKYSDKTTLETLREITDNEELIGVLTAQYGDYGMPPSESSFAMHAMVAKHYFEGGFYPVGGSGMILDTIAPLIQAAGGKILTNAEVLEVKIEGNKAVGVKMKDGREIHSNTIVSNAGVLNTYGKLLPEAIQRKHGLQDKLQKIEPSVSHVCLYIGLKHTDEELGLRKANYWIYPYYDHDKSVREYLADSSKPFPVTYISFPSAKDPDWKNRYPGRSTIEIITLAPYEWFEKWEDTRWKKRGEDYDQMKEDFAQRMLAQLYKHEPQLEGKVDFYELSTPLSTRHFCAYDRGEIYGLSHDPSRFRQRFLRAHTPVKNLFLTGQDIVTVGIGGALSSAVITCSAILNSKSLIQEIFRDTDKLRREFA